MVAICAHMLMVADTVNPRVTVTVVLPAGKPAAVALTVTGCGRPGGLDRKRTNCPSAPVVYAGSVPPACCTVAAASGTPPCKTVPLIKVVPAGNGYAFVGSRVAC